MLISPEKFNKKRTLILVSGLYQFPLIEPLILLNQDVFFLIHSDKIDQQQFLRSSLSKLSNCYFEPSLNTISHCLTSFKAILSTACRDCTAHAYSCSIVQNANNFGIPTFELQHGLFQLGVSYSCVPDKTNFFPDSYLPKSVASKFLSFYPVNEEHIKIGYPPFNKSSPCPNTGEYFLILTNLNWKAYSEADRLRFYDIIRNISKHLKNDLFIWKLHPAEINWMVQRYGDKYLLESFPDNIVFHNIDPVLSFSSTSSLIRSSRLVITVPSTVLLDCQLFNKRTHIFFSQSTSALCNQIRSNLISPCQPNNIFFDNFNELINSINLNSPLQTKYLYPFDNTAFRQALNF